MRTANRNGRERTTWRDKWLAPLIFGLIACGFWAMEPGWAGVTKTGDTSLAADAWSNTIVGNAAAGTLQIDTGSSHVSGRGYLANNSGSSGTATVTGAGSTWNNTYEMYIGNSGTGTLNIQAGGHVTNRSGLLGLVAGKTGNVTVTGTNSAWTNTGELYVGYSGVGLLRVEAGGQLTNADKVYIGCNAGSNGTVTITGAGSKWTDSSSELNVGYYGRGTLNVQTAGEVTCNSVYLGRYGGLTGTATVSGTGARWTIKNNLSMGGSGSSLTVDLGGMVSDVAGSISGTASVRGTGSKWLNSGPLAVGGSSTFSVESGAQVSSAGGSVAWTGTATVKGAGTYGAVAAPLMLGGRSISRPVELSAAPTQASAPARPS